MTGPRRPKPGARTGIRAWLGFVALLVLPVLALRRLPFDPYWLVVYPLGISTLTYWIYAIDKRRAQAGEWRAPEARLHLLELLGGWPGAWLAQQRLRHKSYKRSYQSAFWGIVIAHQLLALDALQNWKFTRSAPGLWRNGG